METLKVKVGNVKTIPVELEDDEGNVRKCTLREMTGLEREQQIARAQSLIEIGPDGKPTVSRAASGDGETFLISLCLVDEEGNNFSPDAIRKFPASAVSALAEACEQLNGLNVEAKEEAKNA
jgi:hypothetical protein